MFKIIQKMRQKSDPEKKLIAFAIAVVLTLLIFVLWLATELVRPNFEESVVERESVNPFNDLKNIFAPVFREKDAE